MYPLVVVELVVELVVLVVVTVVLVVGHGSMAHPLHLPPKQLVQPLVQSFDIVHSFPQSPCSQVCVPELQ